MPALDDYLHADFADVIHLTCGNSITRGVTKESLENQLSACRWFIESLYQAHNSLPALPFALPLSKEAYSPRSNYGIPFSYLVTKRVCDAAIDAGFAVIKKGKLVRGGKGFVSRIVCAGKLLKHFDMIGPKWQAFKAPPKESLILINTGAGGVDRRIATASDYCDVHTMQDNLNVINSFMAKQCIYIDLPNTAFLRKHLKSNITANENELIVGQGHAVSFQNVYLRRIFAQGSMTKGGRFYGGWWQQVRSKLRRRIIINDSLTAECDYSGLAFNMLYAKESIAMGTSDPYDIGLGYKNKRDPRRAIVKEYMNAILNDSSGRFKLDPQKLSILGLTHLQLKEAVHTKHCLIRHYFSSGVGVELQYLDSILAEKIMLTFIERNEVCLPIHDSFIVRRNMLGWLISIMKQEFHKIFNASIEITPAIGYAGFGLAAPKKSLLFDINSKADALVVFDKHQAEYSKIIEFHHSWELAFNTESDLDAKYRQLDIDRAQHKDLGYPYPFESIHLYTSVPVLLRHF